jgi:hypothetical protein
MRPFPLLAVLLSTAFVAATVVDPEHWFGDGAVIVAVSLLAGGFVAFSWWDLWSTRHER